MNRQQDFRSMRNIKQLKRQGGMTGIGIAIILALIAFFTLIGLRLFPIYMEHFSVASHLDRLTSESDTKNKTNEEILNKLKKSLQIDDVKNVNREHIFIDRHDGGSMTIAVEYEVRTPAIGNVDMVVKFSDEVEIN